MDVMSKALTAAGAARAKKTTKLRWDAILTRLSN